MDTTDVRPYRSRRETFTGHVFKNLRGGAANYTGDKVRVPSNRDKWPPPMFFDAVYASAVLHHFGPETKGILVRWGDVFYPNGPMTAARADAKRRCNEADAKNEKSMKQKEARQRRFEARNAGQEEHT